MGERIQQTPAPLYSQIMTHLLRAMEEGRLKPGDRVPSERELSQQFGVSRMTARQALVELQRQGCLLRVQGKGTFVAGPKLEQSLATLTSFTEDMRRLGLAPGARVLAAREVPAGIRVANALGIAATEPVFLVERLRLVAGEPVAMEWTHVPVALCPGLADAVQDGVSLYEVLDRRYGLRLLKASQTLECILASPVEAELLGVPESTLLMMMERVARDQQGRAVEYTRSLYRGDRFCFTMELVRQDG